MKFLAAIAVLAVVLLPLIFLWRKRQSLSRINSLLDERFAERTRLARDLNDSFLQTVEASKLLAENALSKYNDVAEMRQALEMLSQWLGRATEQGRSALDSLRGSIVSRNELAEAFQRATDERATPQSMEVTFSLVGESRDMDPIVRDDIYRIGYEAIRNAYMHSNATHLTVDLVYGRHGLSLRVLDNGCGIDFHAIPQGELGPSGLRRMQQQAARIGSKLTISSNPSVGTEVHLRVPGSVAWREGSRLFRRSIESRKKHREPNS
jgi:signal transduction histidine kinase